MGVRDSGRSRLQPDDRERFPAKGRSATTLMPRSTVDSIGPSPAVLALASKDSPAPGQVTQRELLLRTPKGPTATVMGRR